MCKPKLVSYTGEDAAQKFGEMLQEHIREISNVNEENDIWKRRKSVL